MIIDTDNKQKITLSELPASLKSYQASQLSLMGFQRHDSQGYLLETANLIVALATLIQYLQTENITFQLSARASAVLASLDDFQRKINKLKQDANRIKNGTVEKPHFNEVVAKIQSNLIRQFKPHQIGAAYHLYVVGNGANFSVPGSGKTTVVLSVYEQLRKENKVNILFVVGPPACFGPWKDEFEKTLGRTANCCVLAGLNLALRQKEYYATKDNMAELYLTTYQTLLNDQTDVRKLFENPSANIFFVIDEAHYMKKVQGNWASAVLLLAEFAKIRCVLTGTPTPRSYMDIFNIFDFLWPGGIVLTDDSKTQIKFLEDNHRLGEARDLLRHDVGPLFYRVKKSDLGLLPPIFHPPYLIEMNPIERRIYDAIEGQIRAYAQDDYLRNIDVVRRLRRGRIIRLRQCLSYIPLISESIETYDENLIQQSDLARLIMNYDLNEQPNKVTFLLNLLNNFRKDGKKVVIWANFIKTLDYLEQRIKGQGMPCALIYGKTPVENGSYDKDEKTREKIREEFIDPKSGLNILLANPAACAESISLHKTCHDAVYYDLSYNCAQYLQSLDRIHRVGGSETVEAHYHFLQYQDTIESDIRANLENKAQRMYQLINEDLAVYSLDLFDEGDEDETAFRRIYGDISSV